MMPKCVLLPTDIVVVVLLAALTFYLIHVARSEELKARWRYVVSSGASLCSLSLLCFFLLLSVVDSVHFRPVIDVQDGRAIYDVKAYSLLDKALGKASSAEEKSYSMPLATQTFEKISRFEDGKPVRDYEPLKAGGAHLKARADWAEDVIIKSASGLGAGLALSALLWFLTVGLISRSKGRSFKEEVRTLFKRRDEVPYEAILTTCSVLIVLGCLIGALWPYYHVMGTDQTGNDVLYQAFKSVRTALVIGTLATLTTLPFAVVLGICAGFFKGWVDDLIQYLYTTLSSIPSVLLIAASVLMIQVFIDSHPGMYATGIERADLRLFMLSIIIGLTGWATLARLLRAETLKISQLDYIQAARAFGLGPFKIMKRHVLPNVIHIILIVAVLDFSGITLKISQLDYIQAARAFGLGPFKIMKRHVLPNVIHIILIVAVLDFSGIVLYEAVLSYVGVGVDPTTHSFGSMINAGRLELSRTPVVWWNLCAAFTFMLTLVLSANLFASAVREAFDPRLVLKIGRKE